MFRHIRVVKKIKTIFIRKEEALYAMNLFRSYIIKSNYALFFPNIPPANPTPSSHFPPLSTSSILHLFPSIVSILQFQDEDRKLHFQISFPSASNEILYTPFHSPPLHMSLAHAKSLLIWRVPLPFPRMVSPSLFNSAIQTTLD